MVEAKHPFHHFFILILFLAPLLLQGIGGSRVQILHNNHDASIYKVGWKRLLVGSVAPICTFNECRGCKYRCMAEQVPIEGNDPINTAYYYKCVCHR
ncbi:EPIDERMAL PATTERNING FACTOR-like protein 9 [Salvia divinorum]|uniref:EPIDERMAL PATTERNING FACTOR-like protein 9 n=1 Tax=Salvia divinorum TaxID=28513 RepID=A0ABD1FSM8_SALDI